MFNCRSTTTPRNPGPAIEPKAVNVIASVLLNAPLGKIMSIGPSRVQNVLRRGVF